jgi:hypothetical protein
LRSVLEEVKQEEQKLIDQIRHDIAGEPESEK